MIKPVLISDFDYDLPDRKIAKYPIEPRDTSKLLLSKNGVISHHHFEEISELLPENSLLIFNDTKVIPARLHFKRQSGALIEVFLLQPIEPSSELNLVMLAHEQTLWQCIIGNKKKWKKHEVLGIEIDHQESKILITAELLDVENNWVCFKWNSHHHFSEILQLIGDIPLPPYLNRETEISDIINYQTVYSRFAGAVAAPTAGLHFSDKIIHDLKENGIKTDFLTLHVGAGTFMPVKTENALEHPMHNEQIVITKKTIKQLLQPHANIIPVGTTAMRSLESLFWFGVLLEKDRDAIFFIEKLLPYQDNLPNISKEKSLSNVLKYIERENLNEIVGRTEIMIFPSYIFRICGGLITNFHQPKSTLLLLVAALIGDSHWKQIYETALNNDYRFLSFGDSSLLIP